MKHLFLSLGLAGLALVAQDPEPKGPVMPKVGEAAPTATLNNHAGELAKIGPADTWTLLAFYPKAATPG